jgi:hypothetical protein
VPMHTSAANLATGCTCVHDIGDLVGQDYSETLQLAHPDPSCAEPP